MSLRKTTFFIIVFCFTILVIVLFITTKNITYSKFKALEDKLILSNLNRGHNAIYAIISNLEVLAADWAFWDDTYQFLQGNKKDYIDSNLPVETFINQKNNIIMLLNIKKELVWGKYLPPLSEELIDLPAGIEEKIVSLIENSKVSSKGKRGFKGVTLFNNIIYMIVCKPILTSNLEGESAGWFIMARELEQNVVKTVEERTELAFEIVKINDTNLPQHLRLIIEQVEVDNELKPIITKQNDTLICSGIIRDIEGNPVALLSVKTSRDIFNSGVTASRMILVAMAITGIFMGFISLFLLEKRVIRRIVTLNNQVKEITRYGYKQPVGLTGSDEIAFLSKNIQEMLVKIHENEQFLTQIFEAIPAGVVVIDEESGIVKEISLAALLMIGKKYEDVVGTSSIQFLLPYPPEIFDKPKSIGNHNEILVKSMKTTLITEKGEEIPVIRSVARVVRDGKKMLLEMFLDFTELHVTQKALSDSEEKYKALFMNTGNATILLAEDATIHLANQEFIKLSKIPENESVVGRSSVEFFHPEEGKRIIEFHKLRRSGLTNAAPTQYETRFKDYNGDIHFINMTISMLPGTSVSICSMIDITEWKKAEQALAKKAIFDSLTNLPNRQLFNNRLEHAIDFAHRNSTMVGVFLLDIDDFKNVNDSMGHQFGDKVLQEVSLRLKNHISKTDTLARLGGDEFTLLIQDLSDIGELCKVADSIIEDFKIPFMINSMEFYLGVSIGISVFPNDGSTPEELIKNADLAMYQSKQQGKNRYRIFTEELNIKAQSRIGLERDLRQSIATENFEVYYQPKISIKTGEIYGMEALVRGKRADNSIIPPSEFIPFAEESGLVVPLDMIVLKKACAKTAQWIEENKRNLVVSVNISTRHFHIKNFVESVRDILNSTSLPPSSLELEVTETALMKDIAQAMSSIEELNDLGVSFSLDDFGTGYSSLYYLSNLPFQTLKIDKSFIDHLCDTKNNTSAELVKIIISLAGNMDMKVVAEGVERKEQLDKLRLLGCDQAQGYLVSKPLPAEQFELFMFKI